MKSSLCQISYNEGAEAFYDKVNLMDNPYHGVNVILANHWDQGWWDMFYDEN
jgi:hypothetical protein